MMMIVMLMMLVTTTQIGNNDEDGRDGDQDAKLLMTALVTFLMF